MFPFMDSLNQAQRHAASHDGSHLLIVAGAGTGKTMTLACRVAWLIEQGVPPARILLLTFTRRASQEMLSRAGRMTDPSASAEVWGGTFHAVANRLLRIWGRGVGLDPGFSVLDQADGADLMDLVRGDLGLSGSGRRFPRKDTLAAIYSRMVNTQTRLPEILESAFPWCQDTSDGIRQVFATYIERKRAGQMLDYDDLLLHWSAAAQAPGLGRQLASLFDHILVDEYQDTNTLQADIIGAMASRGARVTAVGDDAQSIYSFRSATVKNMLEFPQRFDAAQVVTLEENYRSTNPILRAANAVLEQATEGYEKRLWSGRQGEVRPSLVTCLDEAEQCDVVCERILEHREHGVPLLEQTVLFRAAHHSDALEIEMTRRNIPFVKYGGLKFLEAAHVKDVLALLRLLDNPHDEVAWFRVLQLLEGVGPARARQFMEWAGVGESSAPSPLGRMQDGRPPGAPRELTGLVDALTACSDESLRVGAQIDRLGKWLEPVFHRKYRRSPSRVGDIDRLAHIAAQAPSRQAFVSGLVVDPPSAGGDFAGPPHLDEDFVILSTIHSAKGCEWDVVHVINATDGMIPSDMATGDEEQICEERRLLYVALTRARDALHVYVPLRYYIKGRGLTDVHGYTQVSRFLTPSVREHFDEVTSGRDPDDGPALHVGRAASVDDFLARLLT